MKILLLNCLVVFLFASGCPKGKENLPKKITYSALTDEGELIKYEVDPVENTYTLTDNAGQTTSGTLKPESKFGVGFYKTDNDAEVISLAEFLVVMAKKDKITLGFPSRTSAYTIDKIIGDYNYVSIDKSNDSSNGVLEINEDHTWQIWSGVNRGGADRDGIWQDVPGAIQLKTTANNDYAKLLINSKINFFVAFLSNDKEFMFGTQKEPVPENDLDGEYVVVQRGDYSGALWKVKGKVIFDSDGDELNSFEINTPWEGIIEEEENDDWQAVASHGVWVMVEDDDDIFVMVKKLTIAVPVVNKSTHMP